MSEIGPDRDGLIDGAGGAHDQPVEGELEDGRPRLGQTDEQPLEQDPASTPQQPAPALPRRAQQTASRSTPSTSSGPVSQPQRSVSSSPIECCFFFLVSVELLMSLYIFIYIPFGLFPIRQSSEPSSYSSDFPTFNYLPRPG